MKTTSLQEARFTGERALHEQILADEVLKRELHRAEILRQRSMARARLLSEAVRVNVRLLPNVAQSFARLSRHVEGGKELEAYVFADAEINAFVTEGRGHLLVGVSSGAVGALSSEELEFVIGHELGHAAYGHLDVPANHLVASGSLDLERAQLVRSFQRAAEVSADRAGLVCCGSLEVAANAMFKTLSGLNMPGLKVDPMEFAQQWDHLVDEMVDVGRRDQWQLSHPFPPLRMRALLSFWRHGPGPAADDEVRRLLALMDAQPAPKADADDPFLARFLFWGSLYVALGSGAMRPEQRARLAALAPASADAAEAMRGGAGAADLALQRFQEARRSRRTKLSAAELHRLIGGLISVARQSGPPSEGEVLRLRRLGGELGVAAAAVDMMIAH
ncbi:M48 family metallopeptidase [Sorangium sp. So ce854]|uniref:M48 family metallopeptidase n=1 Tax=Sorangium sp. So ce854 TaxID=3133322 RepID=UPI003F63EF6B